MSIQNPRTGLVLSVCGVALQIGIVVALLSIMPGLLSALSTLSASGIGDPASLVGAAGEVFSGAAVGLVLGLLGLVLLSVALVGSRYRAGWLFWFLSVYGIFLLVVVPVGTAFGIFFLVYIRTHRQEFGTTSPPFPAA